MPKFNQVLMLCVAFGAACSDPMTGSQDSGISTGLDSGVSPRDAGTLDSGAAVDGGLIDAGPAADAGSLGADESVSDAGSPGADASVSDAGSPGADAGATDAGARDASVSDAGSPGADASVDSGVTGRVVFELQRSDAGIVLAIRVLNANDAGVTSAAVQFTANGVTRAATELGLGRYEGIVVAGQTSGELPLSVGIAGNSEATVMKTAVVLPFVADAWGQPEAIGGLVNIPGTEDSATVSPDGEWLVVGTYSPIDVLGCTLHLGTGPADGRNTACQTSYGPTTGPARPRLPGAERVLTPTHIRTCCRRSASTTPTAAISFTRYPTAVSSCFRSRPSRATAFIANPTAPSVSRSSSRSTLTGFRVHFVSRFLEHQSTASPRSSTEPADTTCWRT